MAAAIGMRRGTAGAGLSSGEGQHLAVGTPVERGGRISWTGTKRKMTGGRLFTCNNLMRTTRELSRLPMGKAKDSLMSPSLPPMPPQ